MQKKSLWVNCPICSGKTRVKVFESTVLLNFPLYCPWCKQESLINLVKLKMIVIKEPDV